MFRQRGEGYQLNCDFTVAALSFLCSRLIGASEKGRAAVVIQRAFRRSKIRETFHRNMVLMGISCACMARVTHGEAIVIKAAIVLQKAWRAYTTLRKIGGREEDVHKRRSVVWEKSEIAEEKVDIWLQ